MKIIVSPAKTQQNVERLAFEFTSPSFKKERQELLKSLRAFSKDELGQVMKIKDKLLDETMNVYSTYEDNKATHGICLYTGLVFQALNLSAYSSAEWRYLEDHVRILSAFYGLVHPFDEVRPYRLDMKMKVLEGGLYKFWTEGINACFEDELIINLASDEFSKLIKKPMVTISFKEEKEKGIYKTVGTYAKQARGNMLNWLICNQIDTLDAIKDFKGLGYEFNPSLSTEKNLIFTRS